MHVVGHVIWHGCFYVLGVPQALKLIKVNIIYLIYIHILAQCFISCYLDKDSTNSNIPYSKLQKEQDEEKKRNNNDNNDNNNNNDSNNLQRAFLSCDLCAQKMTESYYCPHCLAAYPAHYVKLHTRCTRCVSCPVCTSPLEKIVYSGSNSSSSSSSNDSKTKKKDVYLYQCPFCFWSSNIVGLEASESEALLENLKEKLKRPVEEKTVIMNDIKQKYLTINEDLRKEEDRIEKSKRFHTYKGGRSLFNSSTKDDKDGNNNNNNNNDDNDKDGKRGKNKKKKSLLTKNITTTSTSTSNHMRQLSSIQQQSALEAIRKAEQDKFSKYHILDKTLCRNTEPPLDQRYVSQFHLRNVSPLQHRLNDPLNQSVEMDKYVPQRFHLMTKESYKCPIKECGKYVCKPTLRGRQANYDKRTAVLDYLPRINIKLKTGQLKTGRKSQIIIMVQNRHLQEAKFKFDPSINENDLYSTAKISCCTDEFEIDPADIHIKGGKQRNINKPNGDYIKGKEAGVIFEIEPRHYSSGPRDVKFSVKCIFKTKLQLKDDKSDTSKDHDNNNNNNNDKDSKNKSSLTSKGGQSGNKLIDTVLPYILDFELGPPKATDVTPSLSTPSIKEDQEEEEEEEQQQQQVNKNE